MCICAGVCETVVVVAVGGYIVRKLRKRPAQKQEPCLKCGAADKPMYNAYYCKDCFYGDHAWGIGDECSD